MDLNPTPTQSPQWWLERLVRELVRRQTHYQELEDWDVGDHPLPSVDARYKDALARIQELARTNYYGAIRKAPVERMRLKGFRWGNEAPEGPAQPAEKPAGPPKPPGGGSGKPSGKPGNFSLPPTPQAPPGGGLDTDVSEIWTQNDLRLQEKLLYGDASRYGHGYLLVSPPAEGQKWPTITYEDTRQCVVDPDPARPGYFRAGLKLWGDDVLERTVAVLYLPDRIYMFMGAQLNASLYIPFSDTDLARRLVETQSPFALELQGSMPNPLGDIPLCYYQWRDDGLGEAEDAIDIQSRINSDVLDRLKIARDQAFRQKWITGAEELIQYKKRTGGHSPLNPGSDAVWVVGSKEAKMGEFGIADLRQILDVIQSDVCHMAAMMRHPAHYLMGNISNVSGNTLSQAEAAFVAKVRDRQESAGWAHERMLRMAFKMVGNSKADEPNVAAVWHDPEVRTLAENTDALCKQLQAGLPPSIVLPTYSNYTAEEIALASEYIEQRHQEQMVMQQEQIRVAAEAKQNQDSGPPAKSKGTGSQSSPKSAKRP